VSSGVKFDDEVIRDREKLTEHWGRYFRKLYQPSESPDFDDRFKQTVCTVVDETFSNIEPDKNVRVLPEEVSTAIMSLPKGKACGEDCVFYEHLIYAKDIASRVLANLFTFMLRLGYIPDKLKRGVIITLHKGGNKRKDNPNNYRAITLSSVILKVYELILLSRCKDVILSTLNMQQGGFQEQLGCLMTSFVLRESVFFAREHFSKLYVCFLDGEKAFDTVWHQGLFYKLIECNIDKTSLISIREMYRDATSCVRHKGLISHSFPVLQGTRQGGKTSPLCYLVYINGLIKQLEASDYGFVMYNIKLSSPTVADDMYLVSFSKGGMDKMLDICNEYSRQWRYRYNAGKCGIIVFNEDEGSEDRTFFIGRERINEVEYYTHLGIECDKYMSTKKLFYDAANKLRGTLLSIVNSGIHPAHINPITSRTIYRSVVLPKALYGCELWNVYSASDIRTLELSHRFCVKFMQTFKRHTSTDFALSSINIDSIEEIINYRKLNFLGQLCRLPCQYLAKQVFITRLIKYLNFDNQSRGFIPDVYRLLQKYNLESVLYSYLESGVFPSKYAWKVTLRSAITNTATYTRVNRLILSRRELCGIIQYSLPATLWYVSRNNPKTAYMCSFLMESIGSFMSHSYVVTCRKCNRLCENQIVHLMCFCTVNNNNIIRLWDSVIEECGMTTFIDLLALSPEEQCWQCFRLASDNDSLALRNYRVAKSIRNLLKIRTN
jgi:hypothetical protein